MQQHTYEVVIKAENKWYHINWSELWRYRDLVALLVKRSFTLTYKQTILGPLWLILNPLFTSVVFTFVFGQFAGISTDGVPQMLFYMAGNTLWGMFNACVTGTANTFVANSAVMGKVYFPRLVMPVSQTLGALVNFGIQFLMQLIFYFYFLFTGEIAFVPNMLLLLLPILLLQTMVLGLGIGIIVSSLTTKYRDLAVAVGFGMQLWMYATPIVYPLSSTVGAMRMLLLLNPMTAIINNYRYVMLGSGSLLLLPWALSGGITLLLFFVGVFLFNKVEKNFMDTV